MSKTKRRVLRRRGLFLCAVLGLAHVLALIHLVTVPHVACAEHGEIAHGVAEHARHGREADESGSDGERWNRAFETSGHGEHCSIPSLLRTQPFSSGDAPRGQWLALKPCAEDPPTSRTGQPAFPLYLLAPKTSPPARG